MAKIQILTVGIESKLKAGLEKTLSSAEFIDMPFDMEKLLEAMSPPPAIILSGMPPAETSITEVAQLFRGIYPQSSTYLIVDQKLSGDRKNLIKNGFTDVFILPLDQTNLTQVLRESLSAHGSSEKIYKNVKILDLQPGTTLDFDTYIFLPANNKHIKFSKAGDSIDEEQTTKLKSHSVNALSIPLEDMKKFYTYTAQTLKNIQSNSKLSETEKSEKLESSVRELITGLFSDTATSTEHGKEAVTELQSIVKNYITETAPTSASWYSRFLAISAQGSNTYSQASTTSSFAALFAIGLGIKGVEDIALAGLLHDLGLAKIPQDVINTPESERIPVDQDIYESHPEMTIEIIKDRKLIVSENVHKIILQHHENYNGTGYPKKLIGERICIGAQILSVADALFDLTKQVPGNRQLTPKEAIHKLLEEASKDPGKAIYNPVLLKQISNLFG